MSARNLLLALVPVLLLVFACSGRDQLGGLDGAPLQTLPLSDALIADAGPMDGVGDLGDVSSDLTDVSPDGEFEELTIDVPPIPCESDDDCPVTGAEPCFVSRCIMDEDGLRSCRAEEGLLCDQVGQCTKSLCAAGEGCVDIADNEGEACEDSDACTTADFCKNGVCTGTPADCDDGNPCTADLCDADAGDCYHLSVPTECDDGNACTSPDQCVGGVCTGGPVVSCDDFNDCTNDLCDPADGCHFSSIPDCCLYDLQCTDGSACTLDLCENLACTHQPLDCDDNNFCTSESCDDDIGCLYEKVPGCCQVDNDCGDSDLCTYEWCQDSTCQYADYTGCVDQNPCTADSCDSALGCVFKPIDECCLVAADCEDGDACTYRWCAANECQTQIISCSDGNACTSDSCDAATGCFFTPIPGCCLTALECDDNNACTEDWCSNKLCKHKAVACLDVDICTGNLCDPDVGCIFPPIPGCCHDDTECADTDPCTVTACVDQACQSNQLDCQDGNPCTADSCFPGKGCQHEMVAGCCLDAIPCNDGDPCTVDSCVGNQCVHTPLQSEECCQPDCVKKECGPNGCGGLCGNCVEPDYCNDDGLCVDVCIPECDGMECGPDGCGTFCGICPGGYSCSDAGQCIPCFPDCGGKECGPDGCGSSCGLCPEGLGCDSTAGQCVPPCDVCEGPGCYMDGFEAGELEGWSFDGDAEVIHNMGVTVAPQGWYMAFVGTGLSELELGKLQKTFCPSPTKDHVGFKWRLYSAEFTEWCGSIYQDRFIVTVSNGSQEIVLLDLMIDDLCPASACAGCGGKFIGLEEADVEFDYPDVWMTPWSTAFFELPPGFTNTPVTVTLEVSDVGDMVYVTAVLLDAIQFL